MSTHPIIPILSKRDTHMLDVTNTFPDLKGEVAGLAGYLLYNSCSDPCLEPENEGYDEYEIKLHCFTYRVIARYKYSPDQIADVGPVYDIKAVYIMPS